MPHVRFLEESFIMDENLIKELVHEFVAKCPGHPSRDVLQFVSRMIRPSFVANHLERKKQAIMRSIIVMRFLRQKEFTNKGTERCHAWHVANVVVQQQFCW